MDFITNAFSIHKSIFTMFGYQMSFIELLGTSFGLLSVWLATKANIHTWTTGFINVIAFFAIYYQVQLYSDMFLQIFFLATSGYGLWQWRKQNHIKSKITVVVLSSRWRLIFTVGLLAGTIGMGMFISGIHMKFPHLFPKPSAYPFADAFTTILSVAATFLMAYRRIECWILWICVDLVSIYLYIQKDILLIAMEYCVFLVMASYGLLNWIKLRSHGKRLSIG